jgi:type II secretory pathway pseudopilin PulG
VELLVVVAIITLLLGLLMPALSGFRMAARRTTEMSSARQVMAAYLAYAAVNQDQVMPGYKTGLHAVDAGGKSIEQVGIPFVAARYPWRLAPFLKYQFKGLYLNEHQDTLDELENNTGYSNLSTYDTYVYLVSLYPSLGLNATWVGGHQGRLGFDQTALSLFGRFYVSRTTEVRRPEQLVVFCSARGTDPEAPQTIYQGYYEVRSPYFTSAQGGWPEEYRPDSVPGEFGFVSPRFAGESVVAFMDGHVDGMALDELRDMRHWARDADREDWYLQPQQP